MTALAAPASLLSNPETRKEARDRDIGRLEGEAGAADQYDGAADFAGSYELALATIRARKAAGGPGWEPK